MNLYNDIDPYVCDWTENLISAGAIPVGRVDRRPIQELTAKDVDGYTQAHFFSGICGWPLALRLAGWPESRPVWTASLPCQPFSAAGKQRAQADERHLWPDFFRLVCECRPYCIFGEQVPDAIRLGWLDGVFADLEGKDYACGAVVLPAASIKAPHIRHRICWVAIAKGPRYEHRIDRHQVSEKRTDKSIGPAGGTQGLRIASASNGWPTHRLAIARRKLRPRPGQGDGVDSPERLQPELDADADGVLCGLGDADSRGPSARDASASTNGHGGSLVANGERTIWVGNARGEGFSGREGQPGNYGSECEATERDGRNVGGLGNDPWSDFRIVHCLDGKYRRIGSRTPALAPGLPRSLGPGSARSDRLRLLAAKANRVGRIRGYGNAIVPELVAGFVEEVMACIPEMAVPA